MRPDASYHEVCGLITKLAFLDVEWRETNSYYGSSPSEQLIHISKRIARFEEMISDAVELSLEAKRMITHGGKPNGTFKSTKTNTLTV